MDMHSWYKEQTVERLLKYAVIDTQSKRDADRRPSTPGQMDLLRLIRSELEGMGILETVLYDEGFLIARIPASPGCEQIPAVGFMAHVDTAGDVSGKDVKPQMVSSYDGSDITLGNSGLMLRAGDNPELQECVGKDIITTDGTTLLGADDKAGAAVIITAAQYLMEHEEISHGPIELIFTSDEETGTGMDCFPVKDLQSVCCYTLDGSGRGSIEAECFYAVRADVTCTGVSYHLGRAKGRMVNAVTMASSFIRMLPQSESPESTEDREGYYCALSIQGDVEHADIQVYIRDFDRSQAQRRANAVNDIAKAVEAAFPGGSVTVEITWQYENMLEEISKHPGILETAEQAMRTIGIEPRYTSIRGGTDGARLTAMGIPAPNLFTGGNNYHSRYEWLCSDTMAEAAAVVTQIIRIWTDRSKEKSG